jgi:hypothetical protein
MPCRFRAGGQRGNGKPDRIDAQRQRHRTNKVHRQRVKFEGSRTSLRYAPS